MADGFLFAMMTTKSKPTWRHATWNSADYMVCTVVEPQKKLPVFKPGKWSFAPRTRTALYGHDAKSMKNFTLHFDSDSQCESLDRLWFGEMWFRVENRCAKYNLRFLKTMFQIQPKLTSNLDKMSQNCAFRDLKFETRLTPFSIVVPPMYYFQGTCYLEEHVHWRSLSILLWARKRLNVGE